MMSLVGVVWNMRSVGVKAHVKAIIVESIVANYCSCVRLHCSHKDKSLERQKCLETRRKGQHFGIAASVDRAIDIVPSL